VQFENIDEANYSARVKAQGSDDKGRGSANATATFRIEPADMGSRVFIHTDLMLSGAVAQYGRGVGMIQATAAQIIGQFATNLRSQLERPPPALAPIVPSPPIAPALTPAPQNGARSMANAPSSPLPEMQPSQPPPAAKPISGLTLLARVIWQQLRALFSGRKD
jgi:hypothetical protein